MENSPLIFGIVLQSSMILALGAQNLFILEKGILKDRPLLIATICSICDIFLILLGVMGAGTFFGQNETLLFLLKLAGAAFLFKYAYGKYKEAKVPLENHAHNQLRETGLKALVASTLAVTFLNPHVYLDAVVLIGGYSTQFITTEEKLRFAMGAGIFSIVWFFSLSMGASFFSSTLRKPKAMKCVNYGAAMIMTYLGVNLLRTI